MEVTIWIALIAGLVSFLSPCVLPLVPAYVGYMGGRMTHMVAAQTSGGTITASSGILHRVSTLIHGLAFVAGFTFVFVVIGLLGTAFITQIGRQNITLVTRIISHVGGVIIILFGLHFMGVLQALIRRILERPQLIGTPITTLIFTALALALIVWALIEPLLIVPAAALLMLWVVLGGGFTSPRVFWNRTLMGVLTLLYADTRRQMNMHSQGGLGSSALMGVVFAAGWTPCIGPIYGSILTLAVTGTDIGRAAGLLAAYSFGLGIPFLLTALLLDSATSVLRRIQRHVRKIELVSGAFLVLVGLAVATGRLQDWSQTFATQFADLSYRLEECAIDVTQGELPLGSYFDCVNQQAAPLAPAAPPQEAAPDIGVLNTLISDAPADTG
ncbi:cytochrome c biogenesis protein CcdA [Geitlerinema splendidum]|nr:cytochrome c biogenesis protein CcdA [Geitlerinema splendidum]